MKAIQVTGPRQLVMSEIPIPEPSDDEVLVKLTALSVCGTDMMAYRHPQPEESYPLGTGTPCHECAGTIIKSKLPDWPEGRRVIYLPALNLNGGAEYVVDFLPKVKIEVAIAEASLDQGIEAITKAANTG